MGGPEFLPGIDGLYLVGGIIIKMILDLDSDSLSTPYYAGLNLVFIGFCLLLPVPASRTFLHTLVLYAIYLTLTLTMNWPHYDFVFLANNLFVVATLVIAYVGAHTNMRLRWKEYLLRIDLERVHAMLREHSSSLEVLVDKKQQSLVRKVKQLEEQQQVQLKTQQATILGLAKLADSRDKYTGEHLDRVRTICREIALELGRSNKYQDRIDAGFVERDRLLQPARLGQSGYSRRHPPQNGPAHRRGI